MLAALIQAVDEQKSCSLAVRSVIIAFLIIDTPWDAKMFVRIRTCTLHLILCLILTSLTSPAVKAVAPADDLSTQAKQRLAIAGENRTQIEKALDEVPASQSESLDFLIVNMPQSDLQSLSAEFLLVHVAVAHKARKSATWGDRIPETIFRNNVLPYANVNETRDDVRKELRDKFWPLVRELESPSIAAARLNQLVFSQLEVKYSTKRRRADQGPRQTMESGLASCTGLSILLIDACRACGIPARFVGTPRWSDNSGNHSWVEVWDDGWHFTGAAEPTGDELDKAWFTQRASKAEVGNARYGIFAVSFQKTKQKFPAVWTRSSHEIYAQEVTSRYVDSSASEPAGKLLARFYARDASSYDRCQANFKIKSADGTIVFQGQTKDETADSNDHTSVFLAPGKYQVEYVVNGNVESQNLNIDEAEQTIELRPADDVVDQLETYLDANVNAILDVETCSFSDSPITKQEVQKATALLADARRKFVLARRKTEHESKQINIDDLSMRWDIKRFSKTRPINGHCLVISMHGGGGAPARVNESQWKNQIKLYTLNEGIYVAPRAPTDTWNLWHQKHIDSFFTRLIENMIVFEGVDPNRVYLTGYSAGGDGVYQLAPRMADQFSAAAMMAGHPNETKPDGLRNLPFTFHVGEKDAAYKRNKIAAEWIDSMNTLSQRDQGGYVHWGKVHEGKGHWMGGDDIEGVQWMLQHKRNLVPNRLVWLQDDVLHERFYWLSTPAENLKPRQRIVAQCKDNRIDILESDVPKITLLLRDDLVDLDEPVLVFYKDTNVFDGKVSRKLSTLARTINDRGDPAAMFSASVTVDLALQ